MKKATYMLCLCLLLCVGCSAPVSEAMASWQGSHIDAVIARWGYPDETRNVAGHQLVVWQQSRTYQAPASSTTTGHLYGDAYYGQTTTIGSGTVRSRCVRILEVDKNGYVINWQWKGNDCPMLFALNRLAK